MQLELFNPPMEMIENKTPLELIQLMLKETGAMLVRNEEMNRTLERHEEILEELEKREVERKQKDEVAAKALLESLFGKHPEYTSLKTVTPGNYQGEPLTTETLVSITHIEKLNAMSPDEINALMAATVNESNWKVVVRTPG